MLDDTTNWSEKTISDLYDARSRITHGSIEARSDATDNLHLNAKMEQLTKLCLRKLDALDAFPRFATKESRDHFMAQFD